MLNTFVYNPRFYKGSQWVLYVPTVVKDGLRTLDNGHVVYLVFNTTLVNTWNLIILLIILHSREVRL